MSAAAFAEKRCIVATVGGTGGVVGPSLDSSVRHSHLPPPDVESWPQMLEAMKARGIQRPTFMDEPVT
jgi:hypothetical protein